MSCFCIRLQKDIVKTLDFRHCNLAFVPEEVYDYEETLEELCLDSNNIKDLPRSLFHCEFLKKLSICDNDLCAIPTAIATLVNLEELDISKNGITELPDNIKCCKNLRMVEISVNPLGKLPEGFTQLVNLTQLYLNDTLLNYLPANFGRLVKLTVLELRENRLKALPKSMARLTELERLDLGMNEFRQLPEVIGFFTKLTELWLDSNKLTSIPSAIGNLKELAYLDASCNRIEWLPGEIEGLDSLTDLHLSKNYLQELPNTVGQLSTLQHLKLDYNQISNLPYSIGGLISLEELILTYNDLEELPPSIGLLRKLTHLNVDQNMLLELPPELGSCSAITLLSLHSNLLMTLPDEIGHISSLSVVNLCNNQLRHLPYQVTKLKNLQALWLSENQGKPLIPLQSEMKEELGKRVLTCFLFPQQHKDLEEDTYQSDGESFHASLWEEQRLNRRQIAFDISESDSEHKKKRAPIPYPKEGIKRKILANSRGSNNKSSRSRSRRSNILPNYPSVDTSRRRSPAGSLREGTSRRPRSPASPIADSLHLFQADKEKMAKDKARLRGSLSSAGRQDSDTESVASSTRERVVGRREMRARMERAAMSDTEAFIQSPVWSHTGGINTNKQQTTQNHVTRSPHSVSKIHSRGYESDQVDSFRTPVRSPKEPQMQVRHTQALRSSSVGYGRGYESDQVDANWSPRDVYIQRQSQQNLETNRNGNAASSAAVGRKSWRLSHQRSSGYGTDPEYSYTVSPMEDRESRMADVKQKRDEILPPPYYRVRQLRASAHSRSTPRRHLLKAQPQSYKDYGWIDGHTPSNPGNQAATVTPQSTHEVNAGLRSQPREMETRNQLTGNDLQTSRKQPQFKGTSVRSRSDPSAHSDTELASGQRCDKPTYVHPFQREAVNKHDNPQNDRISPNSKQVFSAGPNQARSRQHPGSGYLVERKRNFPADDRVPQVSKEHQSSHSDGGDRHRKDTQFHDTLQRKPPVLAEESYNTHFPNSEKPGSEFNQHPSRPADFTTTNTRQSNWPHNKLTNPESEPVPTQIHWQTLKTEDGNPEYLNSLEGRRQQGAARLNPRISHSLPRDVTTSPEQPDEEFKLNLTQQKSSSLPRSEVRSDRASKETTTEDQDYGTVTDRQRHRSVKMRLHGGAPNYATSEPELRQSFQPPPQTGTPMDQAGCRLTLQPRGGTIEQRRSQSPVFEKRDQSGAGEAVRFPLGLTSSTPSVGGGSRPQSPTHSRPHSPTNPTHYGSRPNSPKDPDVSQQPKSFNPINRNKSSKLPLHANERHYDSDYTLEKPNYNRRGSDSFITQRPKVNRQNNPPISYQSRLRDSLRGALPTPIVGSAQHQTKHSINTPELNPRGTSSQSSNVPYPDLWPQDSSGYASDQNDQGWKRASCSTPSSSVFQGQSSPPMWRPGSDVTPPNHRSRHPSSEPPDKPVEAKRIPVVIYKNPGLGFSITGGKDAPGNPFRPFDWGIFVTKIQPGGPADGVLRPGDKLLEVNGRSFASILHDDAVKMLRKSNPVSIVVHRLCTDNR
ncbi:uncharacterized protein LOC110980148 [Acanthaster planci]|uniref:Uncharacterized protein LOC110980148 n=1 Tax=Acanthaster planci TaxID=133434 RepID=A0A8B7YII3_ACAPL|nr:uncharacterized protein LOC110980148 [Acanthaster planci]